MVTLDPLKITIRGKHATGKTTVASFIKMFLEENGFHRVKVQDVPPLPAEAKEEFAKRFGRNRERPVHIIVELEE